MANTLITAPVKAELSAAEWADADGVRQMFSIKRSLLYQLISGDKPKIRSITLRRRDAIRGKRLFNCNSIRAYLNKQTGEVLPEMHAQASHANSQRGKTRERKVEHGHL